MVKANATAPAINVIESDKDYKVEVAAPGMTKRRLQDFISTKTTTWLSLWKRKTESTEGDKRRQERKAVTCVANSLILNSNRH